MSMCKHNWYLDSSGVLICSQCTEQIDLITEDCQCGNKYYSDRWRDLDSLLDDMDDGDEDPYVHNAIKILEEYKG